jgi:glycosyltransferase involved in cell wall biosynthesis
VKRILFVIGSLEYSGAARQLIYLAEGLPRDQVEVHVCVLGGSSPWCGELHDAGVALHTLGRTRPFDVLPLWRLRKLLRSSNWDVIHVWGSLALHTVALLRGKRRFWVSAALAPGGRAGRIDRMLLRRAGRIVAFGDTDAARYLALGVAAERIAVVSPAVRVPVQASPARDLVGECVLLGIGPLLAHKGFNDAIWALDILHHLLPNLRLVLVGNASEVHQLQSLAHVEKVEIVPTCHDLAEHLAQADIVVVPSILGGGVNVSLEAQASGKPVVASLLPELLEVIADGVSGCFFPPGDKPVMARQLRLLIEDPARRRAFGEAGRRWVAERFPTQRLVERYLDLLDKTDTIRA